MIRIRSTATLLCAVLMSACGKDAVQTISAPATGAQIKFYNFAVNAPGVNFYANDTKMTAISSTSGTESTTGTVYGGVGNAGFYSAIAPGQYTLTAKIAATTDKDFVVSSIASTLADGVAYSLYTTGFYNTTTKTMESFVLPDALPAIDFTVAYVRFVNVISNANPMTLYAKNTATGSVEVPVGGAIAYKSAGVFTALPQGAYDLNTRNVGSATNVITRLGVNFNAGRVYTITARGDITVTSATATNRPILDNTNNR
jgi:hypothetical protein